MNPRIIAFIMTVAMILSPLTAIGIANADCGDHICNCHIPDIIGHEFDPMTVMPLKDCCCRKAGDTPCNLTVSEPSQTFRWVLSSKRIEAPPFHFYGVVEIVDPYVILEKYYPPDGGDHVLHAGAPPIFLSDMSFLCWTTGTCNFPPFQNIRLLSNYRSCDLELRKENGIDEISIQ